MGSLVLSKRIPVSEAVLRELRELKEKTGLGRYEDVLSIAWPRCPVCGGRLYHACCSNVLVCSRCGRRFTVVEARGGGD